jgi:putative nucleotidyltransferase with HDIG domain
MDRQQAFSFLKEQLKDEYTLKHSLALEAIMRALAKRFNEDVEKWGITGLVHDIDWDLTKQDMANHSLKGAEMLERAGFDKDIVYEVKAHNEMHGIPHISLMGKCLGAADNLTGLIIACALVRPDKKLASVKPESVMKKFKEKSFAAGTDRERIRKCEEFGIPLLEFVTLGLSAMQEIAPELGL